MGQYILSRLSPLSRKLKHRSALYRYVHAYAYALRDVATHKNTYSQWGEDRFILDFLRSRLNIDPAWIYVDVGANHPTLISDTYLFYRLGYSGICLEPNRELARVFRTIRHKDKVINAAAGDQPGKLEFFVTDNPVFSSLMQGELEDRVATSYSVPVLRLDDLPSEMEIKRVFLLKIDTEGFDQQVLEGAMILLHSTMIVLTETRNDIERQQRQALLGPSWRTIYAQANTIFVNNEFLTDQGKRI